MNSLLGVVAILLFAWLLSTNRKNIRLKTVGLAFALQVAFALLVLYVPAGKNALNGVTGAVSNLINYGQEGIAFLFGGLATGGFTFAINVLGIIIFFSALISGLYHIGLMPKVINLIGGALQKLLGTGRAESLSATANIFVGMIEAPLVVKPYLKHMSDSQFLRRHDLWPCFSSRRYLSGLRLFGCGTELPDCCGIYVGTCWSFDGQNLDA